MSIGPVGGKHPDSLTREKTNIIGGVGMLLSGLAALYLGPTLTVAEACTPEWVPFCYNVGRLIGLGATAFGASIIMYALLNRISMRSVDEMQAEAV